jgi:hypothetical protein
MAAPPGLFCLWADSDANWTCERCGAVVPKTVSADRPFAGCKKGMKDLGVTPTDLVQATPREIHVNGPGAELKKLLSMVGITAAPDCSCNAHAAKMNLWGADECERRIDEIVGWLREEATKRGLPFIDAAGRMLVRRAIANAKRLTRAADPLPSNDSQPARRPHGEDPVDTGSDHQPSPIEGSASLGDQPPG